MAILNWKTGGASPLRCPQHPLRALALALPLALAGGAAAQTPAPAAPAPGAPTPAVPTPAVPTPAATTPAALEQQVKAAYLYKFAGFVEWPEGSFARADSALVIGVAGADALADQLEQTVAGHTANGRPVQVRRLRRGESPAGLHILFVGALDRSALQELLAAARSLPVLTVSESDEVYALGSMVNFVVAGDKLRFEVALKPVASVRMKISARMLAAAYRVQGGAS